MIGKAINSIHYSVNDVSYTKNRKKNSKREGDKEQNTEDQEEKKQKRLPLTPMEQVSLSELEEMVSRINDSKVYQRKGIRFECDPSGEKIVVKVIAQVDGTIIQKMSVENIKNLFNFIENDDDAPQKGSLLNISY
ncbi:MAG: flagellar protein FlaG [Bacteriovoracaceae bacterium]|nr:flagellar protein FlaG [Bacteriovoracaceae bacterium]